MSLCISSTSNQASRGARGGAERAPARIGEPIELAAITSTASSRVDAAALGEQNPSLKASICAARLMLTASLSSEALAVWSDMADRLTELV